MLRRLIEGNKAGRADGVDGARQGQQAASAPAGARGSQPSGAEGQTAPPDQTEPLDASVPRYEIDELIASGAEGHVYRVSDRDLERRVAMKVLRGEISGERQRQWRFLEEARCMAGLEHPSIPAVYDVGHSASGELYFTMRLVQGRTLQDIFRGLREGGPGYREEWTLYRLIGVLQQVTAAVDYAHAKNLLHRDLKPANIGVGHHGEVLVLDWGLAKRFADEAAAGDPERASPVGDTQAGAVVGTPLYMSPEQAKGQGGKIDARSDIFALGGMLYEMLCLLPPHDGRSVREVLKAARRCEIVPPSQRVPSCKAPEVLEATCMRALSPDPAHRHATAAEFGKELQGFFDGTRELESRRNRGRALLAKAADLAERSRRLASDAFRLERDAESLRADMPPWTRADLKQPLWQTEDLARLTRVNAAHVLGRAMDFAFQSLSEDPQGTDARRFLAELCFERFVEASEAGNEVEAEWLRRLVHRYNDGPLDEHMRDEGQLRVETVPPGATVTLARFTEVARRMQMEPAAACGLTPVGRPGIPTGRYLVTATLAGYAVARVPVDVRRALTRAVKIEFIPADHVPSGFVWVPGGAFLFGEGKDRLPVEIPGFLIAKLPVLLEDYAQWLDELHRDDPASVGPHMPWTDSHGPLLHLVDGRHVFCPASPIAPRPLPEVEGLPVVGITRESGELYARWLGRRLGCNVMLPTEMQWEKAARGTDGRLYPWGDRFDATFCSMAQSAEGEPNLRPAGSFPVDASPYWARDMAGGVREWCRDDIEDGRLWAVCRGGAWHLTGEECTVLSRALVDRSTKSAGLGLRLVIETERPDQGH